MVDKVIKYLEENRKNYVDELTQWLRIPSISTLSQHAEDVHRAALWAENKLQKIGFPLVEVIEGNGHPLVYAEWLSHDDQPTLLIYGHYDVQPTDPLAEWRNDPFDPVVEEGNIYARGATDDKGQVMLVMAALDGWARTTGNLPINIKVLLEGEEEAGGEFIEKYVNNHADRLKADCVLICDTHMNSLDQPSLVCGLRGIQYTEVKVTGPKCDLHSGSYGGVAPNPLHAICLLISRLKGEDGKINISGMYDSPVQVSEKERNFWQDNAEQLTERLHDEMGVDSLYGENEILPHERMGVRPTLEVHGISGGFVGEGAKTVIPSEATAKVSMRLPAGMKPADAHQLFHRAVLENMPEGYGVEITDLHGGSGISVNLDNDFLQAAASAVEHTYGVAPVFMREGGSIPIASLFDSVLQLPVVLMGFGLPDDGAHSPNEKFSLTQFAKGMDTVADYFGRLKR